MNKQELEKQDGFNDTLEDGKQLLDTVYLKRYDNLETAGGAYGL